jgi:hypothetical protein
MFFVFRICRVANCATERAEFRDLELDTTIRALEALQMEGKCALFDNNAGDALVSTRVLLASRIAPAAWPKMRHPGRREAWRMRHNAGPAAFMPDTDVLVCYSVLC